MGNDPTTVFGEKGALGNAVQPGKQGQASIKDLAHHMAVAGRPIEFESQQGTDGMGSGNHFRAGEAIAFEERIPRDLG